MSSDLFLKLADFPYFDLVGVMQLSGLKAQSAKVQLSRWEERGLVVRLKKGIYTTSYFVNRYGKMWYFPLLISAVINLESYVSREYVLQSEGILADATYSITAVTIKNTGVIDNSLGVFDYGHVKQEYYHGFVEEIYHGIHFGQATKVKALFDFLYLRPLDHRFLGKKFDIAEELRLDLSGFTYEERASFEKLVVGSGVKKLVLINQNFKERVWRD